MRDSGVRVRIGALATIAALALFLMAPLVRTARAQSAAGTVSSAIGPVQIQRGGATLAATPGAPVYQGDRIVSGADGSAVIILTDRSELGLSPSTTITLDQYTNGGATPTRVGLGSGILKSFVNGTADFQVHTPNAIVTAHGTDFYTAYTQNSPELGNLPGVSHYTTVAVIDGTVSLAQAAAPDSGVDVGSGTTGTVAGDQPPRHHHRKFPTPRPTPTRTPRPTHTPRPTRTPRPTPTPRPTHTPRPTRTPRRTPRPEPTPEPTPRPRDSSRSGVSPLPTGG